MLPSPLASLSARTQTRNGQLVNKLHKQTETKHFTYLMQYVETDREYRQTDRSTGRQTDRPSEIDKKMLTAVFLC